MILVFYVRDCPVRDSILCGFSCVFRLMYSEINDAAVCFPAIQVLSVADYSPINPAKVVNISHLARLYRQKCS